MFNNKNKSNNICSKRKAYVKQYINQKKKQEI